MTGRRPRLGRYLRALAGRMSAAAEARREIAFHLDMRTRDLEVRDLRDGNEAHAPIVEVAASVLGAVGLSQTDAGFRAERIAVHYVTGNPFSVLGVEATHGRVLHSDEGWVAGDDLVIVLTRSHRVLVTCSSPPPPPTCQIGSVAAHCWPLLRLPPRRCRRGELLRSIRQSHCTANSIAYTAP